MFVAYAYSDQPSIMNMISAGDVTRTVNRRYLWFSFFPRQGSLRRLLVDISLYKKKKVLTKWTTIQASNNQFISLWVCHCHFLWPFKIKAILNYLKENSKNVIILNDLSMPDLGARRFLHPLPWILNFWDNNLFKCDITFLIANYYWTIEPFQQQKSIRIFFAQIAEWILSWLVLCLLQNLS